MQLKDLNISHPLEGLRLITLSRPKFLNAFNLNLIKELVFSLKEASADESVSIIAIAGEGRAFSAGGDLNAMKSKTDMFEGDIAKLREIYRSGIQEIPRVIESIDKPIIALVDGAAVGAGCDLACMCDIRLVSDKGFFKESFINLSLVSGDGGSYFLQRIVGYARSMDMLLTGRKVDSSEALSNGLAQKVFPSDQFNKLSLEYIGRMLDLPQAALRMNKLGLRNSVSVSLNEHLNYMSCLQSILQRSSDHEELVDKFLLSRQK